MRYGRVKMVAVHRCGQCNIYMTVLKAVMHRVMTGVDCEQSLIFLCKFTKAKHASRNKQGRKPEKKK